MNDIPVSVLELAEDTLAHAPLRTGDRRIVTPRYVLTLGLTPGPRSTVVTRLRIDQGEVASTVHELRALLAAEGRATAAWEVGPSATPVSIRDELVALELQPAPPPFTVTAGMVLAGSPPRISTLPDDLRITRVATLADFRRAQEIYWRCFDFIPDAAAQAGLEVDFGRLLESRTWCRYLAWQGKRAVAAADAGLTPVGVILFGGATLPEARGHGVYQALVWERWQEAVRQGTPYLITQAGTMSRPILAHLGFVTTAEVSNFNDRIRLID